MKVLKLVVKRKDVQNKNGLLGVIFTLDINECLMNAKHYWLYVLAQSILTINTEGETIISILQRGNGSTEREVSDSPKAMSPVAEPGIKPRQPAPDPTFYT